MKISTEIHSSARLVGEERAVALVAQAGFDGWDYSMFGLISPGEKGFCLNGASITSAQLLRHARRLREIGLDGGIVCNQSHAPFPTNNPDVLDCLKLAIECTAEAGGQICVIHPMNNGSPQENAEMYAHFLPFARDHGVKIATENMWNWDKAAGHSCFAACATAESFLTHLKEVNDPFFVACLDIGHGEMQGSGDGAANMIRALSHHLQALHLHDNDRLHDSHQLPMTMDIDFGEVVAALQDIRYDGWFTLEADNYLNPFTEETLLKGLKEMAAAAKKLARMFEKEN